MNNFDKLSSECILRLSDKLSIKNTVPALTMKKTWIRSNEYSRVYEIDNGQLIEYNEIVDKYNPLNDSPALRELYYLCINQDIGIQPVMLEYGLQRTRTDFERYQPYAIILPVYGTSLGSLEIAYRDTEFYVSILLQLLFILHVMGVEHGNILPENILVDTAECFEEQIKINDLTFKQACPLITLVGFGYSSFKKGFYKHAPLTHYIPVSMAKFLHKYLGHKILLYLQELYSHLHGDMKLWNLYYVLFYILDQNSQRIRDKREELTENEMISVLNDITLSTYCSNVHECFKHPYISSLLTPTLKKPTFNNHLVKLKKMMGSVFKTSRANIEMRLLSHSYPKLIDVLGMNDIHNIIMSMYTNLYDEYTQRSTISSQKYLNPDSLVIQFLFEYSAPFEEHELVIKPSCFNTTLKPFHDVSVRVIPKETASIEISLETNSINMTFDGGLDVKGLNTTDNENKGGLLGLIRSLSIGPHKVLLFSVEKMVNMLSYFIEPRIYSIKYQINRDSSSQVYLEYSIKNTHKVISLNIPYSDIGWRENPTENFYDSTMPCIIRLFLDLKNLFKNKFRLMLCFKDTQTEEQVCSEGIEIEHDINLQKLFKIKDF